MNGAADGFVGANVYGFRKKLKNYRRTIGKESFREEDELRSYRCYSLVDVSFVAHV